MQRGRETTPVVGLLLPFFLETTNSSEPFTIPVKDVDSFEHNRSDNFTRTPGPSIQSDILTTEHITSKKVCTRKTTEVFPVLHGTQSHFYIPVTFDSRLRSNDCGYEGQMLYRSYHQCS
jgi:hypothetical protein